jgi:hypothetical protein
MDFHRTVIRIPNPPGQSEAAGFLEGRPTETHALNTSFHSHIPSRFRL